MSRQYRMELCSLSRRWQILVITGICLYLLSACGDREEETQTVFHDSPGAADLNQIGEKIFLNECAGRHECLVHWNQGEAFPSLGIGHFIWFPEDVEAPYTESFPALLAYMRQHQVELPAWFAAGEPIDAPWPDRESFLLQSDSSLVRQLRQWLWNTRDIQAAFMWSRARQALQNILQAAGNDRNRLQTRLAELTASPQGIYALVDYINFKGEGLNPEESYQGEGWGLRQVLTGMDDGTRPATLRFSEAAARVLTRRANLAAKDIERERWLPGWLRRVETYHPGD